MQQQHAIPARTGLHIERAKRGGDATIRLSPRQNHLLASLPTRDYMRLLPHLALVPLPMGWTVQGDRDPGTHLYFPISGIVSNQYVTEAGATTEVAIVGNEGVVGVAAYLGGEAFPSEALVLHPGHAYRLDAGLMREEFDRQGAFTEVVLRYAMALITQIAQIAMCIRHHEIEQQLCRTLLSSLDRLSSNDMTTTHEVISARLGVRREGVTMALGNLQGDGLVCCSRGHITVLDRDGLQARVCECYWVVKREYERLLTREGTVPFVVRGH